MKKLLLAPLALALLGSATQGFAATTTPSQGSPSIRGWYEAGGAIIDDASLNGFAGEPVAGSTVEFDTGFWFGLGLGHEISRFVALEVEGGFQYNQIKSISGATSGDGKLYQVPIMANLVLQYPNKSGLVPMIGGGAGAVGCFLDANNITVGGTTIDGTEDSWTFGYQGYAGLAYQISPSMTLGVTYHYLVADGPSWSVRPAGSISLDKFVNQSLSLNFGFKF